MIFLALSFGDTGDLLEKSNREEFHYMTEIFDCNTTERIGIFLHFCEDALRYLVSDEVADTIKSVDESRHTFEKPDLWDEFRGGSR